ncbi:MAG: hypothetical protein O6946_04335 [Gammaproteobacteria bacterium]|nr:hypothetical protein [Gammaproteobacteria bacterium]MCZ6827603.1 hypothetical protein [Gammaproteobacteria bacterium]
MAAGFLSSVKKTILTLLLACSILSACVIFEEQTGRRTVDMTHVKSINQQAEFRNIDIIWVNPPTKIESGIKNTLQIEINGEDADPASAAAEEKEPQQ